MKGKIAGFQLTKKNIREVKKRMEDLVEEAFQDSMEDPEDRAARTTYFALAVCYDSFCRDFGLEKKRGF